jgi:hypothetical protein
MIATSRERRAALRYKLNVPAVFHFKEVNQTLIHGTGMIRDISTAGVFVLSKILPGCSQDVEIEVLVPHFDQFTFSLRSVARVLRLESVGFAAFGDFTLSRPRTDGGGATEI